MPIAKNAATRWLYTGATRHIVTTGETLRRQLIDENRFPPERLTSVPTGIDARRFAPGDRAAARGATGLPADRTLIGIVATLRSWKGHRFLIDAFARLEGERLGLVIVGGGPQREAIEAQVASLGLGDRVVLAGDQADVLPWLQALDVFALPSYANEGVPQALVQAMLCGLACVTTGIGAIPEAARDGETAVVVPPQDVEALAQGARAPRRRPRAAAAARTGGARALHAAVRLRGDARSHGSRVSRCNGRAAVGLAPGSRSCRARRRGSWRPRGGAAGRRSRVRSSSHTTCCSATP